MAPKPNSSPLPPKNEADSRKQDQVAKFLSADQGFEKMQPSGLCTPQLL